MVLHTHTHTHVYVALHTHTHTHTHTHMYMWHYRPLLTLCLISKKSSAGRIRNHRNQRSSPQRTPQTPPKTNEVVYRIVWFYLLMTYWWPILFNPSQDPNNSSRWMVGGRNVLARHCQLPFLTLNQITNRLTFFEFIVVTPDTQT